MLKGRIIKGVGGKYFIATEEGLYKCSIRGVFRKGKITPTVGDYVKISVLKDEEKAGVIEEIEDRKNILVRPKVCNIDCAVITFAIKSPNANLDLLDRFLALAENENIENIIICINKCDLATEDEMEHIKMVYTPMYDVVFTDTLNGNEVEKLKGLIDKKVTVFAGPSGVGKSSIINYILPKLNLKIGEISRKIERGKHTTRQVELLEAWEGTYIVDSPGFTSLSMEFIEKEDFSSCFREFRPFLRECKFCDCKHIHEPNCAVKNEIGKSICKERYERYTKLLNEVLEGK